MGLLTRVFRRNDALVELRSQVATLERDLEDRDEEIRGLRNAAVGESDLSARLAGAGEAYTERLLEQIALPMSLLFVNATAGGGEAHTNPGDLELVYGRLLDGLKVGGVTPIGAPGQPTDFDPALHEPLADGPSTPGEPCVVRIPGWSVNGTVTMHAKVGRSTP